MACCLTAPNLNSHHLNQDIFTLEIHLNDSVIDSLILDLDHKTRFAFYVFRITAQLPKDQ